MKSVGKQIEIIKNNKNKLKIRKRRRKNAPTEGMETYIKGSHIQTTQ